MAVLFPPVLRLSPAYWLVIALYVAIGVYVVMTRPELMKLENPGPTCCM
ncbi:MAG: hypothetical protein R3F38_19150 [Gammaproteobacteria bacterium]